MGKKPKEEKAKLWRMSKEERTNLQGRAAVLSQQNYVAHCIERDMDKYVEDVIKKRCGIPKDKRVHYDIDEGILQVIEAPKVKVQTEKKNEPIIK